MYSLTKKIELGANLAIIAVAVLLGVVVVRNFIIPGFRAPQQAENRPIQPGSRLSIPGVTWNAGGTTLVLALSTDCRFCTESAPFYLRVAKERATNPRLRVIALFPQSVEDGQDYLEHLGVKVDEVKQVRLESLGLTGTPTLVLANNEGIVEDSWRGKLHSDDEEKVLRSLK